MPDPTGDGWTIETLRTHFQRQLDDLRLQLDERHTAQNAAVQAALLAAEKAVNKAERAAENRFESVNEFRAQLGDQQRTFLPRQEYDVQHRALDEKLNAVAESLGARIDTNAKQINDAQSGLLVNRADELARRGVLTETRAQANWTIGQIASILAALLAAGIAIYALLR